MEPGKARCRSTTIEEQVNTTSTLCQFVRSNQLVILRVFEVSAWVCEETGWRG